MKLINYTLEMNTRYELDNTGDNTILITELHLQGKDNAEINILLEGYFSKDAYNDKVKEDCRINITKSDLYTLLAILKSDQLENFTKAISTYLNQEKLNK